MTVLEDPEPPIVDEHLATEEEDEKVASPCAVMIVAPIQEDCDLASPQASDVENKYEESPRDPSTNDNESAVLSSESPNTINSESEEKDLNKSTREAAKTIAPGSFAETMIPQEAVDSSLDKVDADITENNGDPCLENETQASPEEDPILSSNGTALGTTSSDDSNIEENSSTSMSNEEKVELAEEQNTEGTHALLSLPVPDSSVEKEETIFSESIARAELQAQAAASPLPTPTVLDSSIQELVEEECPKSEIPVEIPTGQQAAPVAVLHSLVTEDGIEESTKLAIPTNTPTEQEPEVSVDTTTAAEEEHIEQPNDVEMANEIEIADEGSEVLVPIEEATIDRSTNTESKMSTQDAVPSEEAMSDQPNVSEEAEEEHTESPEMTEPNANVESQASHFIETAEATVQVPAVLESRNDPIVTAEEALQVLEESVQAAKEPVKRTAEVGVQTEEPLVEADETVVSELTEVPIEKVHHVTFVDEVMEYPVVDNETASYTTNEVSEEEALKMIQEIVSMAAKAQMPSVPEEVTEEEMEKMIEEMRLAAERAAQKELNQQEVERMIEEMRAAAEEYSISDDVTEQEMQRMIDEMRMAAEQADEEVGYLKHAPLNPQEHMIRQKYGHLMGLVSTTELQEIVEHEKRRRRKKARRPQKPKIKSVEYAEEEDLLSLMESQATITTVDKSIHSPYKKSYLFMMLIALIGLVLGVTAIIYYVQQDSN